MKLGLAGRTAIVAGGASNIGRQITLSLAEEGVNVALVDLDHNQADRVVKTASGLEGKVVAVKCDVTLRDDVDKAVTEAIRNFGPADILVNCVGWAEHKLFVEKEWHLAEREMAINFWGALYMSRAVLPPMIERRSGKIVCVTSDAGKAGENREAVYSAAKAGVMGFVRTLAKEVGRYSINVNGVCPSMTVPEADADVGENSMHYKRERPPELMDRIVKMYPLRRVGKPIDVANLVVFLSSDASSFITGQNISVNGGFLM